MYLGGSESKLGEVRVSVPQICKMGPAVTTALQREQMPDASAKARTLRARRLQQLDSIFPRGHLHKGTCANFSEHVGDFWFASGLLEFMIQVQG